MCRICNATGIDLSYGYNEDRQELLNILRDAKEKHPWFYSVGPMSDEERVWYDLNSPLRKKK